MADEFMEMGDDEELVEMGEEEIRLMAVNRVSRDYETLLTNIQSKLGDAEVLQEMQSPWFAQLDFADMLEEKAVFATEVMAVAEEDCRLGADVFAGRPGEEALVEVLREDAAWSGEQRARAEEIATSVRRRLQETCLRATAADKDPIWMATMEFLDFVSDETDGGKLPWPTDVDVAARALKVDATARAPGCGARFAQKFCKRAERLRRGAVAFKGEVLIAETLRERAAWVEAMSADVTFVEKLMSFGYWKLWMIMCESTGESTTAAMPINQGFLKI